MVWYGARLLSRNFLGLATFYIQLTYYKYTKTADFLLVRFSSPFVEHVHERTSVSREDADGLWLLVLPAYMLHELKQLNDFRTYLTTREKFSYVLLVFQFSGQPISTVLGFRPPRPHVCSL